MNFTPGLLLLLVTGLSLLTSLTFWLQYGVMGVLLGPLKTWSYVFYGVMMVLAWRAGKRHLASGVWSWMLVQVGDKDLTDYELTSRP